MSLFLTTRTFTTEALVQASPAEVRAFLEDLPAFIRLNPLVIAVAPTPGEPGTFVITDRLRFLGLPYDLRYKVRIALSAQGLDAEVWSSPATHLVNELRLLSEGDATRVRETIHATVPRPLASYIVETAGRAHREMLDALAQRVEARTRQAALPSQPPSEPQ